METLHRTIDSVAAYVATGLLAMVAWLVRKVLTNEKRIDLDRAEHKAQMDLILSEMKTRDDLRQRDREDLQELKRDVKDLISRGHQ